MSKGLRIIIVWLGKLSELKYLSIYTSIHYSYVFVYLSISVLNLESYESDIGVMHFLFFPYPYMVVFLDYSIPIISMLSRSLPSIMSYILSEYSSMWNFYMIVFVAQNWGRQKFILTFFGSGEVPGLVFPSYCSSFFCDWFFV